MQALIGSVMSLLITGSVFYIAYRAMAIGADFTEMKDLLRSIERNTRPESMAAASHHQLDSMASSSGGYPLPLPADEDQEQFTAGRDLPVPVSRRAPGSEL